MFSIFRKDKPEIEYPNGYKVYTTQFDQVIAGAFTGERQKRLAKRVAAFDRYFEDYKAEFDIEAVKLAGSLRRRVSDRPFGDTVVSILVDHSGSMRGQRGLFCLLTVSVVSEFLSRLDVHHEILGFTTSSWHGGLSRKRWISRGKIENPGRLCDLLHIVYRDAEASSPGAPYSIRMLLDDYVLKENIDGEALLWAASRLEKCKQPRKIILHFSDGAPVDNSTLSSNPADILQEHMHAVIRELSMHPDYRLGGIGIDHDVKSYFFDSVALSSAEAISDELLPFVVRLLSTADS